MSEEKTINRSLSDILLDPDSKEPITLKNENGLSVVFEQVAVIPLYDNDIEEDRLFVMLKTKGEFCGSTPGEWNGFVFLLDSDESGQEVLKLIQNQKLIDRVYEKFEELVNTSKA
ncbi:MAG: hypothetical protein LUD22_02925 [Coprobacillus sp.]|nr:hypothetical protein [Coprobacillus sp.]